MKKLALVALLLSCGGGTSMGPVDAGDPRAAFLGDWVGSFTSTTTFSGQSSTAQGSTTWEFTDSSVSSDRVEWRTKACDYQAKVTSETSFIVDPVNCSGQSTDGGCLVTVSITTGTGTRSGTSLSVTLSGNVAAQCGGGVQNGTLTTRFDGSHQ